MSAKSRPTFLILLAVCCLITFHMPTSLAEQPPEQDNLTALLDQAGAAQGADYVKARDQIIALGQNCVPQLQAIKDRAEVPWQRRMMAGIVLEYIQRGEEIRTLLDDFRDSPEGKRHKGLPIHLPYDPNVLPYMKRRWIDDGLQYQALQLVWKGVGEIPKGISLTVWDACVPKWLEEAHNPELLYIAREQMQHNGNGRTGTWCYDYLLRAKDHASLPTLFGRWLDGREAAWLSTYESVKAQRQDRREARKVIAMAHNQPIEPEAVSPDEDIKAKAEATEQTTKCLRELLAIATPEDVGWITKKLQDIPLGNTAQGALNDLQRRAQQKP